VSDIVDNAICSDESWLLVGDTGSSCCTRGGMINLMDHFGPLNGCHVMIPVRRRLGTLIIQHVLDV